MTDKIATASAGFLGRVDAILDARGHALESQDLPHFNWYQAFIIGQLPADAVDDALRNYELPDNACAGWGCVDTCGDCAPDEETLVSIFSLAFEQAERELGARIGYPALVYTS